jgi:hypothetical protein
VWRTGSVLAAAGLLFWGFVSASVPCAFARTFHMPCPGCGSTRAMLCLLHGDVAGALRMNPLAPLFSLLVGSFVALVLFSLATTGTLSRVGQGHASKVITGGLVVVAILQVVVWLLRFAGLFGGPVPV